MRDIHSAAAILVIILIPALLLAECAPDYRSDKKSGLLVTDLVISGTTSLDSVELAGIRNRVMRACVNEDPGELEERVRALFEDKGYFAATVTNLNVKPADPLANPKPAVVEAEVAEGPRYRLAGIEFTGNHAVSTAALRDGFPMKKGDVFARDKVASGLLNLRKLYAQRGFMDFTAMPDTASFSNATVQLAVAVTEGTQYHMGELKISAKKETADRLYAAWKLPEGAVFDLTYLDKYIDENRSLLPPAFTRNDILLVADCPNASIEVMFTGDQWGQALLSQPHNTPCEAP